MKKRDFKKLVLLGVSAGLISTSPFVGATEDKKPSSVIVTREGDEETSSTILVCGEDKKETSGTILAAKEDEETSGVILAATNEDDESSSGAILAASCGGKCGAPKGRAEISMEDQYPQYSNSQRNTNSQNNGQMTEDQHMQNGSQHCSSTQYGCKGSGGCSTNKPNNANGTTPKNSGYQRLA